MTGWIKDIITAIPRENAPIETIVRFCQIVGFFMIATIIALLITWNHVPGVHGMTPKVEMLALQGRLDRMERTQLKRSLIDIRSRQCQAIGAQNREAMKYSASELAETLQQFEKLTGSAYYLPSCDEL